MTDTTLALRSIRARHISWLTIALGVLTVGSFLAISDTGRQYITPMAISVGSTGMESSGSYAVNTASPATPPGMPTRDVSYTVSNVSAPEMMGAGGGTVSYRGYPTPYYGNQDVAVTDTREFLKTYYSASMLTRDVPGLVRRVETTVRGYGGRIDQESSSPQYGSVSFAVSQAKYDAFRTELEALVNSRFLTVNISSQNLLPQKQSIEEQQKQADTNLADSKAARSKIVSTHSANVKSLQSRIDADAAELVTLRAQTQTPQIQAQIQGLVDDSASLTKQLANENASYTFQLSNADSNIKYAQDWQKAVQTQDQTLLDNVATVTGTVSIQWISIWDMIQVYLPGYWIPGIFALLTLLSYIWDCRKYGTV